uniref:Uncharacterized protein n=1 Tax=Anguilla anguilla TaxID=7936 RepID=A0A0E9SC80_ANGAN
MVWLALPWRASRKTGCMFGWCLLTFHIMQNKTMFNMNVTFYLQ